AEPALIAPDELLEAVKNLADAVKTELGEKASSSRKPASQKKSDQRIAPTTLEPDKRSQNCLAAMLRMRITDRNDGSGRLYAAACRAIEHDLHDADALATIRAYEAQRPFPRPWSDE